MSTQRVYTTFVRLLLSSDGKHVKAFGEGYCLCQGGALGDCTHVAAALFTLQDLVYLAGRVPGEKSRILSCTERLQNLLYAAALPEGRVQLEKLIAPAHALVRDLRDGHLLARQEGRLAVHLSTKTNKQRREQ